MIISPLDISRYIYCPLLPKGADEVVYSKNSFFELCIGEAIIKTEQTCLIKGNDINSRKIMNSWDSIWWPACPGQNISFKEAQDKTIKASLFFLDYCKYDFIDYSCPTVATDINAEINVGQSILKAHVDIMKVDLRIKEKNIMLIDFKKKNMSTIDVAMDPGIGATALAFSRNKNEIIQYVIVEINESNKKLFITQAIFRPEQLQNTYKMICSVEENIRKKINYGDRWKCQECKQCPSFKSLMREDFLLRQ